MMMFAIFVCFMALSSLGSARLVSGPCPKNFISPRDFDLDKYLGLWYDIYVPASNDWYALPLPKTAVCATTNYTRWRVDPSTIYIERDGYDPNNPNLKHGESMRTYDTDIDAGTLLFQNGVLRVIDTDYTSYTVEAYCRDYFGLSHKELVSIRSRTRNLDPSVVDKAYQKIAEVGFKKPKLTKISQENCPSDK